MSVTVADYMVLDGGLATELVTARGHDDIDGDPLWNSRLLATHPEEIEAVHMSFLECGADVIETASYQASVQGFVQHLNVSEEEALQLIAKSVHVAQAARDKFWSSHDESDQDRQYPLVAGCVGPYGACLCDGSEYSGAYVDALSEKELADWHRPRITALLEAGADLLALDTVPALKEARSLVSLLKEFPNCRAWLSFSCKDGLHTCHGELFSQALRCTLGSQQVIGVGLNCTAPQHVNSLLEQVPSDMRAQKRIVVYPNSGEQWSADKKSPFCTLGLILAERLPGTMRMLCGRGRYQPGDVCRGMDGARGPLDRRVLSDLRSGRLTDPD